MTRSLFNHCPYFLPTPRLSWPNFQNKLSTAAINRFFMFCFFSHFHSGLSPPDALLKFLMPDSPLHNLANTFRSQINTQKSLKWLLFKNDSFLMSSKTTVFLCLPFLFMDAPHQSSMLASTPDIDNFQNFVKGPLSAHKMISYVCVFLISYI